jgi:hypothetical protein
MENKSVTMVLDTKLIYVGGNDQSLALKFEPHGDRRQQIKS